MGRIRILKQVKCLECDTIGILCKSLCENCYRKKTRNTPEGKLKIKLYNDKVQRQKLLNRIRNHSLQMILLFQYYCI